MTHNPVQLLQDIVLINVNPSYAVGGEERAELSAFSWGYPDLEKHFSDV